MKGTIKQCRTWQGMTQKELAEKVDVSVQTICGWEKGTYTPSGKKLQEMANVFGISADDIILP